MEQLVYKRLYKKIIEDADDAIIFTDSDGVILLWNKGAVEIFGFDTAEALGRTLDIIIPDAMRTRHWDGYRRVIETGETKYTGHFLTAPGLRQDGSRISLEFSILIVRDKDKNPVGVAAIIRDVTEKWEKEKEMKSYISELEEKLRLAGVS